MRTDSGGLSRKLRFITSIVLFATVFAMADGTTLAEDTLSDQTASKGEVVDDFEDVRPSLTLNKSRSLAGVKKHVRSDRSPFRGRRSEYLSLLGYRGGERILATRELSPIAMIPELEIRAWLRGNRVGYQLMARVRLPRSRDQNGDPLAIYVLGDRYSATLSWQQLRISHFESQVANQVRALRVETGWNVDSTEAYVDQVAINCYGGAGVNKLWLDELTTVAAVPVRIDARRDEKVRLANVVFDSKAPMIQKSNRLPRITFHRGVDFAQLKQLGFNTIWLSIPANAEQISLSEKLDLDLICPPPSDLSNLEQFTTVAAWHLAIPATDSGADSGGNSAADLIHSIRQQDPHQRPIAIASNARTTSDVQLIGSLLHENSPGTTNRWSLVPNPQTARWLSIRNQLRKAAFAGYNGFIFDPGDLSSADSTYVNAVAELVNLELSLLRPWIMNHDVTEKLTQTSRISQFKVSSLMTRHGGIAWVQPSASRSQSNNVREVDIPDSQHRDVYHLEPGSLEPARDRRVPGGIRVTLNHNKPDGLLLLSNQPQVLQDHKAFLHSIGKRYNELLLKVIRHEMLELDRELAVRINDPTMVGHLRREINALHGRIAPVLESRVQRVNFRQLDHLLGQLERVHQLSSDRF